MTTAIEVTKREMYARLADLKEFVRASQFNMQEFEAALEIHLEVVRLAAISEREKLHEANVRISERTTERDTLRNRVQVLEMANQTSGEVIRGLKEEARQARKNFMAARLAEVAASVSVPPYNASGAPLDAKTTAILGAVVDCQRIVTDWAVNDLKAKQAIRKVSAVVNGNPQVLQAMKEFEVPETAVEGAIKDLMIHGVGAIWMTPSDDGIEVSNQPADEMFKQSGCMHSFHQCYGSRETCTFCGVGK